MTELTFEHRTVPDAPDIPQWLCRGPAGVVDLCIWGRIGLLAYHATTSTSGTFYADDCEITGGDCWHTSGVTRQSQPLIGLAWDGEHEAVFAGLAELYRRMWEVAP